MARPVKVRLAVAHLYTASLTYELDYQADIACTLDRYMTESQGSYYKILWQRIQSWHRTAYFKNTRFPDLTDQDILALVATALRLDTKIVFTNGSYCTLTPEKLRHAMIKWDDAGWDRYEIKRAGKAKAATTWGIRGAFLALSIATLGAVPPRP